MDIFATKGIEYLLVIGYLLLLIPAWLLLRRSSPRPAFALRGRARPGSGLPGSGLPGSGLPGSGLPGSGLPVGAGSWFQVPEGFHFHRGHTWARPGAGGVLRVGVDDFAAKLLGPPEALELPAAGDRLEQGERGWRLRLDGRAVDLLSPVSGEVTAINPEVLAAPRRVAEDPYGLGWLLEVRPRRPAAVLKNLLLAPLARTATEEAATRLGSLMGGEIGVVLQDGGVPLPGFVRHLAGERWPEMAAELLLTA